MKKDTTKKKVTILKPRNKKRQCLTEIPYNSIEARHPLKKRVSTFEGFEMIPSELVLNIFMYLEPKELLTNCQLVSKTWHFFCSAPVLWNRPHMHVELRWQVRCSKCLVERRSKGKVYTGVLRSNLLPVTLRKVYLDITNAGYDDGVPTSLLREIAFLSEMNHDNIARIVSAEVSGKVVYVCTEQGDYNLKDYTRRFGLGDSYKITKSVVQNLMRQIFKGLEYIHKRGIVHRNLKPDNILVSTVGKLKLSDFTLSRMESVPHYPYTPEDPKERERSGREARRLWYRAPELLLRKEIYGSEVDIWTAGCLLGEIVLGVPLFNGENEIEHLFKIFKMMGVPDSIYAKSFPSWEKINFCDIIRGKDSKNYKALVSKLIPARDQVLGLLTKLASVIGEDGLDLLQKCLDTNPSCRITAAQALSHPFLFSPSVSEVYMQPMLSLENEILPYHDYLSKQDNISESMRSILVDWLIDVSVHFEVRDETLHLAISYIDRTLTLLKVDRAKLQLVGVTCMKIADVFNERSKEYYRQENSIEYAYITADEYTPAQVVVMEKQILNCLKFRLQSPTILYFLKRYLDMVAVRPDTANVSQYLADLMLLSYSSLGFKPSVMASAVLFIACVSTEFPDHVPHNITSVDLAEFDKALEHIKNVWLDARTNHQFSRFESINLKHQAINPRNLWPPVLEKKSWV